MQRPPEQTTLNSVADCRVGMKVHHTSLLGKHPGCGEGEVEAIDDRGVHVRYLWHQSRGLYDDRWFKVAAATLVCIND